MARFTPGQHATAFRPRAQHVQDGPTASTPSLPGARWPRTAYASITVASRCCHRPQRVRPGPARTGRTACRSRSTAVALGHDLSRASRPSRRCAAVRPAMPRPRQRGALAELAVQPIRTVDPFTARSASPSRGTRGRRVDEVDETDEADEAGAVDEADEIGLAAASSTRSRSPSPALARGRRPREHRRAPHRLERMAEFIYTMRKARKAHGDKVILDDVTLSFLPAPRSVSSAPTVPASRPCSRSCWARPAVQRRRVSSRRATPSGSSQQPHSTRPRTSSQRAGRRTRRQGQVDRFNEIAELMATDYSDELMEEMGKLQRRSTTPRVGPRLAARAGHGRAALPATPTPTSPCSPAVSVAGSRCAGCCCRARPAAARRAHQPPRRRERRLAGGAPGEIPRHRRRRHHDRYFLDHVAQWILELRPGPGLSYEGNTRPPRDQAVSGSSRGAEGRQAAQAPGRRSSSGCGRAPRPPGQEPRPAGTLRGMAAEAERMRKLDFEEIQIPPGPRRHLVIEVDKLSKGFGPGAHRRAVVLVAAQRHRRRDRAQWGGQDDAVQMLTARRRPTPARSRWARPSRFLRRPVPAGLDPKKTVWQVVSDELDYIPRRSRRDALAGLRLRVRLQGPRPAEAGRRPSPAASATAQPGADAEDGRNLLLLDEPTTTSTSNARLARERPCWSFPAAPW